MKSLSLAFKMFAATFFTFALCTVAQAQVRTWVSGDGNDFDPCSRTAPCRTFAGALGKTSAGGEIDVVDAGSYGNVTINKPITIDGGGFVSAITATISDGITINVAANEAVVLRNLTINGQGAAFNGINYISGGMVTLDNVTIEGMGSNGIFVKGVSAANPARIEINNCQLHDNLRGIQIEDHSFVAVRKSVITGTSYLGQTSFGINMQPAAGTRASLKIDDNEISYCQSGIRATSTDLGKGDVDIHARRNWVYKNVVGLNVTNAVVLHTAGDNLLSENDFPQGGAPVTVGHFTF